jgi:hypothetical protein
MKYDKQDQQGKVAFNERNPHMTQQQEPVARSPGGPQTKKGQGKACISQTKRLRQNSKADNISLELFYSIQVGMLDRPTTIRV